MKNIFFKKLFISSMFFLTFFYISSISLYAKAFTENSDTNDNSEMTETITIYKHERETNEITEITLNTLDTYSFNENEIKESKGYSPIQDALIDNSIDQNSTNVVISNKFYQSPNLSVTPYSDTCKIAADDGLSPSSGFLVGSNLLLTCAHCVFTDRTCTTFRSNIYCLPAYDGLETYDKSVHSTIKTAYYPTNYTSSNDSTSNENDWCLCVLYDDLGNDYGWFGCRSYGNNSSLNNLEVQAIGYPQTANFSGRHQYYSIGNLFGIRTNWFYSDVRTHKGMSGGPISEGENNIAVGIIKGLETDDSTFCTRITSQIVDLINDLQ